MSFNRWQKLMAASTEKAVVVACCEAAVAEDELTGADPIGRGSRKPSRAAPRSPPGPESHAPPAQYNSRVAHIIEPASSGRAKCRSCDQPIAKGELRFGERQPNAFGDGEMTL